MSASLAAVPTTVCTSPEATSTPICAFMPKCHWLPFLAWCISGSRALFLFFVEGGAAMIVASTIVPWRINRPRSSSIAPISSNSTRVKSCSSSQWRKFSTVVASGYRHHRQVDPGKPAQGLAIVQRVLQSLVGQPIPLLQKVKPQHPLQPDRRPAALALWIEWPQTIDQPRPRHHPLHLGQKLVPTSLLFLPGVFRLRKAPLPLHRPVPRSPRTGRFYPMPAPPAGFFSASLGLKR